MTLSPVPGELLRAARRAAQISQRELAARAETAQSVVARIEKGLVSPSWDTLARLLAAADQAVHATLEPRAVVAPEWLSEVDRIRALSAEARLVEVANLSAFATTAVRRD